jgi:hypothetical protein
MVAAVVDMKRRNSHWVVHGLRTDYLGCWHHINRDVVRRILAARTPSTSRGGVSSAKTQSCLHGHSAPSRASSRHVADRLLADGPQCLRALERRARTTDDHPHAERGTPSAALRSPASGSRPTHRGRDDRHGSRRAALHSARGWLGDGQTVVVSLDVAKRHWSSSRKSWRSPTHEEADHTSSAGRRAPSNLGIHVDA